MNLPHNGTCKGCKFGWLDPDGQQLFCRRMPPTCFLVPGPNGPMPVSTYAPVQPDQTCGEYKPKLALEN